MIGIVAGISALAHHWIFYLFQVPWFFPPLVLAFFLLISRSEEELRLETEKEGGDISLWKPRILNEPLFKKDHLHLGRCYNLIHTVGHHPPELTDLREKLREEGWEKFIRDSDRNSHMLVAGTTGSGKTSTLLYMIAQDLRKKDRALLIVDPKGDYRLAQRVKRMALREGRRFFLFAPHLRGEEGLVTWNPLASCETPAELSERIYSTLEFSREAKFYEERTKSILNTYSIYIMGLRGVPSETPLRLTLKNLHFFIFTPEGKKFLDELYDKLKELLHREGKEPDRTLEVARIRLAQEWDSPRYQETLMNFEAQLSFVANNSLLDDFINTDTPTFSLKAALRQKAVIFFSLPGTTLPEASNQLGRLLVAELKQLIGKVQSQGATLPTSVYLDEFPVLVYDKVGDLFALARSGGVSVTVAMQNLAQMEARIGRERTREILGNLNLQVIMKQSESYSMKYFSDFVGEAFFVVQSERQTVDDDSPLNNMSQYQSSESRASVTMPRFFRELQKGEAVAVLPDGAFFLQFPYLREREKNGSQKKSA